MNDIEAQIQSEIEATQRRRKLASTIVEGLIARSQGEVVHVEDFDGLGISRTPFTPSEHRLGRLQVA